MSRFRRNPGAARREGFEALDSAGRIVSPANVNWGARPFPYHLRQRPGAGNALGRLRLDLPNPYAVYLHDTPNRRLFAREDRALSHGCIRVENPIALAAALLASPQWDEASIEIAIGAGANRAIELPSPTPVYVLYLTAVAQADGSIFYSPDIYRRDNAIIAALDGVRSSTIAAFEQSQSCPAVPS